MKAETELIIETRGGFGYLRLNRPRALNALSLDMLREMDSVLQQWQQASEIEAVLVTGAGERAFSAGADVKTVYQQAERVPQDGGDTNYINRFGADYFRCEYALDYRIAQFQKPYLAYLDGITMGGGVGISIHGSHRLVNENTVWAMPETGIGFFPDVGASHFLSRLGPIGKLLGLSGLTLSSGALLELGLGTHFISASDFGDLLERIHSVGVQQACEELPRPSSACPRLESLSRISERCFTTDDLSEILESLRSLAGSRETDVATTADEVAKAIESKSPTSLMVTLELFKRGKSCSLKDCLQMEYRICYRILQRHDFYEGVRAALIDKDKMPRWEPRDYAGVSSSTVEHYFQPLGDQELVLP